MNRFAVFAVIASLAPQLAAQNRTANASAEALLHQALEAQGGEAKLRGLRAVTLETTGYRNMLEQSERPEGPFLVAFQETTEVRDYEHQRLRTVVEESMYPLQRSTQGSVLNGALAMRLAGEHLETKLPGTPQQAQLLRERMALAPERLLLTAVDSEPHMEHDVMLQDVPQNVVVFDLDGAPVCLYLNAYTHLPTALDYSGPLARASYEAFRGDVTERMLFSTWWLAKGGVHLPMQIDVETNGVRAGMSIVKKMQLYFANDQAPIDEVAMTIPPEVAAKFNPNAPAMSMEARPLGIPGQPGSEIAPGIFFLPGAWNATFIKQTDGLVILEAPISSGYSAKVIEVAMKQYPGLPIKAVITTSDSWPHLAGIREYVAHGIPIYGLDLNKPILERTIAAPHTVVPDALQRSPRKADLRLVHEKTVIGSGPNRLEIYPIRGETSERQMMVYFPEHRLLYGSDPFQKMPDGTYFYPQTVSELVDAVNREHLTIDKFFMMHVGPTSWAELSKALTDAGAKNTPDGTL